PGDALDHHVVVEVQRAGAQADGDFAGAGVDGLGGFDGDAVEAAAGGDVDGFDGHGGAPYEHAQGNSCRCIDSPPDYCGASWCRVDVTPHHHRNSLLEPALPPRLAASIRVAS